MFLFYYVGEATIQFEQSSYDVAEGDSVAVCVYLVHPNNSLSLGCNISVPLMASNGQRAGLSSYYNNVLMFTHSLVPLFISS